MSFDGSKAHVRMMIVYLALAIGVGLGVFLRLINTQVKHGEEWRKLAEGREKDIREDPAKRGTIYSSDGQILAITLPVCDLYLDLTRKTQVDERGKVVYDSLNHPVILNTITDENYANGLDEVCRILANNSKTHDYNYYYSRIDSERRKAKPRGCYLIERSIPYSTWEAVCNVKGWNRAVVKSKDNESVIRQVRAHIYNNLGENTIGFRNSNLSKSYTGLEGYYDSILAGQDGKYLCRRLTRSVWIKENHPGHLMLETGDSVTIGDNMQQERIDGSDIIATIDTRFQDIAENSLRKHLARYGAESGCAILMESKTGYILACSNLSRDTSGFIYREAPNRNIACSDIYEPGSTFKTVILSAMLSDTNIKLDTAERVRMGWKTFSKYSGEINDGSHAVVDTVSIPTVLALSSNVGMCELGWKYYNSNRNALKERVISMFPYDILHLDLKTGEYRGKVNDLKPDRDFLNFCYGYSCYVSAMQLITYYNAIVCDGRMMKPLFCKGIVTNGKLRAIDPVVMNEQVMTPEVAKQLREMLIGVVQNGTGRGIKSDTYGIGGKTGTATYSYRDQHLYSASFAGFFPAENPKYTCLVVAKNVRVHGSQAAAPVFKDIADCVVAIDKELAHVELKAQDSTALKKVKSLVTNRIPVAKKARREGVLKAYQVLGINYTDTMPDSKWLMWNVEEDSTGVHESYQEYQMPEGMTPNCYGMTIRDARMLLHSMGLKVRFSGYGKVVSQEPKARTPIREGMTVTLRLGN